MSEQRAEYKTATTSEPKYYRCQGCGYILGRIEEYNKIPHLTIINQDKVISIEGDAKIDCMLCGYTTPWEQNEYSIAQLLKQRGERKERIKKYFRELSKV